MIMATKTPEELNKLASEMSEKLNGLSFGQAQYVIQAISQQIQSTSFVACPEIKSAR